jgi:hypothetical protein
MAPVEISAQQDRSRRRVWDDLAAAVLRRLRANRQQLPGEIKVADYNGTQLFSAQGTVVSQSKHPTIA